MEKDYLRSESKAPLQLIDDNKSFFRFFRIFGFFPISYENGVFIVHEKACVIARLCWFLWHFIGMATMLFIKIRNQNDELEKTIQTNGITTGTTTRPPGAAHPVKELIPLDTVLIGCIGILMFILVDPVQTIILKRTVAYLPTILKHVKHLEAINIGNQSSRQYNVSKIYLYNRTQRESTNIQSQSAEGFTTLGVVNESAQSSSSTLQVGGIAETNLSENIQIAIPDINDEEQQTDDNSRFSQCYNALRYVIVGTAILMFLVGLGYGMYLSLRPKLNYKRHDILDEWKFFGGIFYLVFPVLNTRFCVFFIGYQRKMYKAINALPDSQFISEDHIENIRDYFETMQKISKMLTERIYRFAFGINFAIFVICGTTSTYELLQGIVERKQTENYEFGDIIYVFPIAICVFHLFMCCQQSASLVSGQHDKLRYKLKGIMTSLLVQKMEKSKEDEKKMKRVEMLYKNIKDFSPQAEVYGGFKVNYSLLTGMLLFMFSYSRIFNTLNKR